MMFHEYIRNLALYSLYSNISRVCPSSTWFKKVARNSSFHIFILRERRGWRSCLLFVFLNVSVCIHVVCVCVVCACMCMYVVYVMCVCVCMCACYVYVYA